MSESTSSETWVSPDPRQVDAAKEAIDAVLISMHDLLNEWHHARWAPGGLRLMLGVAMLVAAFVLASLLFVTLDHPTMVPAFFSKYPGLFSGPAVIAGMVGMYLLMSSDEPAERSERVERALDAINQSVLAVETRTQGGFLYRFAPLYCPGSQGSRRLTSYADPAKLPDQRDSRWGIQYLAAASELRTYLTELEQEAQERAIRATAAQHGLPIEQRPQASLN